MDQGKEIDSDLTMLQPAQEETPALPSMADQIAGGRVIGSLNPDFQDDPEAAVQRVQDASSFGQSVSAQVVDPDLDKFKSMYEDTNTTRARNQSEGVKGVKAIGGGLLTGGLIFLEELGYVADIDTYTNLVSDQEDLSGNWWTRLMKEGQEGVRESEAFKIYEDDPDENNILSQIFKWTSLEGAVSSAVGFGLGGLGATKLVSAIGASGKFSTLARLADVSMGNIKGEKAAAAALALGKDATTAARMAKVAAASTAGATGAFVGPLASSMTANFFMGQMMAADTFTQSMKALEEQGKIGDGEGQISKLEAQKIANSNAQEVVGLNMALTATAYIKFGSIFKRNNNLKTLVSNPSAINQLKELIIKGSPTAFVENVYQEMIQMEQIHDTSLAGGGKSDYSMNYWDRVAQLALSDRAVHAGALGVVGGPIQFAIIQKPMMGKQNALQKERYDAQQVSKTWGKEYLKNNMESFKAFDEASKKALLSGNMTDVGLAENMGTVSKLVDMVESGTISFIKHDTENIAKMTAEEAAAEGYDSTYKETADALLKTIERTELIAAESVGYENVGEVVYNQMILEEVHKTREEANVAHKEVGKVIADKLRTDTTLSAELIDRLIESKFNLKRSGDRFKGLDITAKTNLNKQEDKENKLISSFIESTPEMADYTKSLEGVTKYNKLLAELIVQRKNITDPAYQKNFEAKRTKAVEDLTETAKKENAKTEEEVATEKAKNFLDFNVVKNSAKFETQVEKADRIAKWDAEIKGKSTIKEKLTFTSRLDSDGSKRVYGEGDLMRSYDGRYFNVERQAYGSKGTTKNTMPILRETDASGKYLEKLGFIPDTHEFLRPEVLQNLRFGDRGKGGKYAIRSKVWAPYVVPDSVLSPNNITKQIRRFERADMNEVITVNNFEYKTNRPKGELEKTDFAKEYAVHELNKPLTEPYQVEFKLRVDKEEGGVFVDVYKVVEGRENYKLTRIDRHSNINYLALTEALATAKGSITGMITQHYSNSDNLVIKSDLGGQKVYTSINEMNTMTDKANLINGKVYIATRTGEADISRTYATSQDGKDFSKDGTIKVMIDGKEVIKTIPFLKTAGDTYALVLSPDGHIVPLTTANQQIKDVPSSVNKGKTTLEDIMSEHYTAVREYFEKQIDLDEFENPEFSPTIEGEVGAFADIDHTLREEEKDYANYRKKSQVIFAHKDALYTHFQDNVYKKVRYSSRYSTFTKDGVKDTATNYQKRKIYRSGYFSMAAAVDSQGKIVPAVGVKSPNDITREVLYNITDHPEKYAFHLGARFLTMDINSFENPVQNIDGKDINIIDTLIKNGALKTDANPTQIFAGSSATIVMDGNDIQKRGQELADEARKTYKSKATEVYTVATAVAQADFLLDLDTDFDSLMEDMVETTTEEDFISFVRNSLTGLEIANQRELNEMITQAFTEEGLPGSDIIYAKALQEIDPNGTIPNSQLKAKAFTLKAMIAEQVSSGKLRLKLKQSKAALDPGMYKSQPENIVFGISNEVYHKDYGNATVVDANKAGFYMLKVPKMDVPVKAWAKDTYDRNGEFHKLFRIKNELTKAIAIGNEAVIKQKERAIISQENKLAKAGLTDNKSDAKAIEDAKTNETTNTGVPATPDANFTLVGTLAGILNPQAAKRVEKFKKTNRTLAIQDSFVKLQEIVESFRELKSDPANVFSVMTEAEVVDLNAGLIKGIPYTLAELTNLVELAGDKLGTSTSDSQHKLFAGNRNKLLTARNLLTSLINQTTGEVISTFEIVTYTGNKVESLIPSHHTKSRDAITNYDAAATFATKVMNYIGESVIAESTLKENLFNTEEVVSPVATPSIVKKTEPKVPVVGSPVAPKPVGVKAPTIVKTEPKTAQTVTDRARAEIDEKLASLTPEERNKEFSRIESLLKTEGEAIAMMFLEKRIKHLTKGVPTPTPVPTPTTNPTSKGENITSKGSPFAKKLTNAFNTVGVMYKGKQYINAEHAYQTWKSGEFDQVGFDLKGGKVRGGKIGDTFSIMANILTEKLAQHQDLVEGIISRGGVTYLQNSTHNVIGDKFWESTGQNKFMEALIEAYLNRTGVPFKKDGKVNLSETEFNAEVAESQKMLPKVPIKVLENLVAMQNKFGDKALGAYDKGVRFLVKGAETGTAYHETMHAVADLYLTSSERQSIAEEYGFDKWSRAVDEKLAEDFEKYATQYIKEKKSPVDVGLSAVKKFFKGILDYVFGTRSVDVTKKVFEKTVTYGYANKNSINYLSNVAANELKIKSIESFKAMLSAKENVTLQNLMDNNKIKITC